MKNTDYIIIAFLLWLLLRKQSEVTATIAPVDDQTLTGLGPGQWATQADGSRVWFPAASDDGWPPCGCP